MTDRVKWGILGNATIARKCVIRAIQKSHNGLVHAPGTRSPADAAAIAAKNGIKNVYEAYEEVLEDPAIDAVYSLRKKEDEVGEVHVIQGADEYQLMVDHFSDAVLGRAELDHMPDDSIANVRALDGLSIAAKAGNTVYCEP